MPNKIALSQNVRFLALTWDEDWEFDAPTVLLEPVVRYDPNYGGTDHIIEEAALEIAQALEIGEAITDEDVSQEFEWRRWKLPYLRRIAREALNGREWPVKNYRAEEQVMRFEPADDGTVAIVDVTDWEE